MGEQWYKVSSIELRKKEFIAIRNKFKSDGYYIFNSLKQHSFDTSGLIPFKTDDEIEMISLSMGFDENLVKDVIKFLIKLNLAEMDENNNLFFPEVIEALENISKKSLGGKEGARKRWDKEKRPTEKINESIQEVTDEPEPFEEEKPKPVSPAQKYEDRFKDPKDRQKDPTKQPLILYGQSEIEKEFDYRKVYCYQFERVLKRNLYEGFDFKKFFLTRSDGEQEAVVMIMRLWNNNSFFHFGKDKDDIEDKFTDIFINYKLADSTMMRLTFNDALKYLKDKISKQDEIEQYEAKKNLEGFRYLSIPELEKQRPSVN